MARSQVARVIVAGCGPSTEEFAQWARYHTTVGCNDCDRWFTPNVLVVGDKLSCFSEERRNIIRNTKADEVWLRDESIGHANEHNLKTVTISDPTSSRELFALLQNAESVPSYVMTPFAAICLAWRLYHPDKIGLVGVDFLGHPLKGHAGRISKKLGDLALVLGWSGTRLINLSQDTLVTGLPTKRLEEL